ncbi:MAG: hypothetical protein M1837_007192 [Sclerophora amabilis]|nr:MAG: hypothetical protein M1837_007192 [Sclerophora amabilis]
MAIAEEKSSQDETPTQTAMPSGHEKSLREEVPSHRETETAEQDQRPYTIFTAKQKACISYAASVSAMFSGLSSFIYYPAITALSESLHVSTEAINLTITSYLVVSGIAPAILGDMADQTGRRPVSLIAFTLYFAANVGLALQNSYTALVILRCLQSAGASGTIAIAYGVIADIAPPAERGSYVGILMGFTNAAPCLGPVIGGIIAQSLSWRWVFWLLSILSGLHLLILLIFLPETSRTLVDDGSVFPRRWINRSLYPLVSRGKSYARQTDLSPKRPLHFPNPFSCLSTLLQRSTFIVLVVGGLKYTIFSCLATSLSSQMIKIYSLNYLTAGLVYLPSGVGGILAAYLTGRLLDHDYRTTARRHELPVSKSSDDLSGFPIEKARLRSVFPFIVVSTIATAGFGWALNVKTHLAVPLVMQFITGSTQVAIFVVCGTLLTDLNPGRSATVQASYNLVRCALSAAGIAALQATIDGVGVGWCFTIYAVIGALAVPLLLVPRQYGWKWRQDKRDEDNPGKGRIAGKGETDELE